MFINRFYKIHCWIVNPIPPIILKYVYFTNSDLYKTLYINFRYFIKCNINYRQRQGHYVTFCDNDESFIIVNFKLKRAGHPTR